MKHPGLRLAVGILVLVLIIVGVPVTVAWWKVASLKNQLAENLGAALGAKVEVTSLGVNLWKGELNAAGIALTNLRPDAPWDRGAISQATIRFHLRDLLSPSMPLTVEVDSWSVVLHSPPAGESNASTDTAPGAATAENPASSHVQITQLSARDGEVEMDSAAGRKVLIHGVAFDSQSNGGEFWTTHLQADSITAGSLELGTSSVEMRSEIGKVTFSSLRMQCAPGIITGEGEAALGGAHETRMNLKAVDIPVAMLVSVDWQMKLSGLAAGTLAYEGSDHGAQAHGQLALTRGKFNVLPFLGKMTALVGLPDITGVEVDQATADFAWQDGALHLTHIDVRKNDVTRISGQVDVDSTDQVDGHLKIGLPASVLSRWPPLQAAVFPETTDDYDWAEVHLTGTPDHLQEDLSSRVLAQGLDSGSGLINQGTQKAADLLKSLLGP